VTEASLAPSARALLDRLREDQAAARSSEDNGRAAKGDASATHVAPERGEGEPAVPAGVPEPAADVRLSDAGTARRLVARHGLDLRYIHDFRRWLVWRDGYWQDDRLGLVRALMKETLEAAHADTHELEDEKERLRVRRFLLDAERESRIRGAIALAESARGIAILPEQLDTDPWLLCVANGTIDLRTGELREHRRDDLITRQIAVEYDPAAAAPTWLAFLERVLDGDQELIRFVQRAVGYSLTGLTTEQIILILWGGGANGKTTLIDTILALLGEYAQQAPAETFVERRDGIPNDVARLRGARMVAAAELGEGRRLNEALVKRMTGGDRLTARFMRGEWFEFRPSFTPWLATNHRPAIGGTDHAIWRRLRLVPFTVTIPEDERDQELPAKLLDELSGILAWGVQGCLDWQAHGLDAPAAVVAATADYRDEMDILGDFLADCCQPDPEQSVKASVLHTRLEYWARQNGREPITQTTLGNRLAERGYVKKKTNTGIHWLGLALRESEQ
jgi:putative DNA primase/helicase